MKRLLWMVAGIACVVLASCGGNDQDFDASGMFESTEVVVSAEATGRILSLDVEEGDLLDYGQVVGSVDSVQLYLRKLQLQANVRSIGSRKADVSKQVAATREQIAKAEMERKRFMNLLNQQAGTQKQVDDIESQLEVLKRQLAAQLSTLNNANQGVSDESDAVTLQIMQIEDQLAKCRITAPLRGTVLAKYAEAGEMTSVGKPLFKLADMEQVYLRAYVGADQLTQVKLGQEVKVYADYGEEDRRTYDGRISWIASQAEFTPKTIQTRDERSSLVYAIKILVKNDGFLKLGMYGEVKWTKP
ncbi:HlyD family efflux transporter periplasmic adaptor subunit [uncultured Phocaeicola sp.]|jgi:HlyD family secretion protein|uniref:HlyD family secretion protein n=1 Tax=uncultured Phocaeicola sp. TaxID=990718 RepID=UPI0025E1237F|nr:HlyD family efflux transporter periplasmic adaptor subunit [uncultured Phocaeicola sp.]